VAGFQKKKKKKKKQEEEEKARQSTWLVWLWLLKRSAVSLCG